MKSDAGEVLRYTTNGLVATGVHYLVLYICVELLNFSFKGLANLLASVFGILFSFVGNKYYVFRSSVGILRDQLAKFFFFYTIVAFIHGAFLYFWSDVLNKSYNYGFIIAVLIQFALGYLSSKIFIFNETFQLDKGKK
jgi:putative flippase GtrA